MDVLLISSASERRESVYTYEQTQDEERRGDITSCQSLSLSSDDQMIKYLASLSTYAKK
jgi:hypothetical protein